MNDKEAISWIIPVLLALAVAAAAWLYWNKTAREAPPEIVAPAAEEPRVEQPSGPQHPVPNAEFDEVGSGELRELPSLADSDQYLKLELSGLLGDSVGSLLAPSRIIERVVATVDSLPRKHVPEQVRPVSALDKPFQALPVGENLYVISEASYRRYDALVDVVASADAAELVDLYRRYYPLFQDAYVALGYPDGYFNDRLVEAIDDMLATPVVEQPAELQRPHVLFEFADPDLESRSSGQKLLLRMGNENARRIKEKLAALRVLLVSD